MLSNFFADISSLYEGESLELSGQEIWSMLLNNKAQSDEELAQDPLPWADKSPTWPSR